MEWMLAFLVILLSALIQSCTGFGFAIFAIPLLMLLYPAHYAISLSGFLSLVSCLSTLPRVRKEVDTYLLKRFFAGSLLGLPIGGLLYSLAGVFWLKTMVSISILLSVIPMIYRIRVPIGTGKLFGFISGFLTSSIGMPGPPIVMFLISKNAGKDVFRGTSIAFYCLVYPISLTLQYMSGQLDVNLLSNVLLVPAIFIGQTFGSALHRLISPKWFRRVTFLLLVITAANTLVHSF